MIYAINLIIVPIYYLIINNFCKDNTRRDTFFFWIFLMHAILFRALANPLNYVDTEGYAIAYDIIADMSLNEAMTSQYVLWGVGYVFVNWLLSRLSSDPMLLFTFISIVSVGGVMWFYKKTSLSIFATSFLYVNYQMLYFIGFGVIRQPFAIVFVLMALYYIDDLKKSIPLAIIAVLLHTASIVFLPFYIWKLFKFEKRNIIIIATISIIGFVVLRYIMSFILSFLVRAQQTGFGEDGDNNTFPAIILGSTIFLFYLTGTNLRLRKGYEKNIFSFIIYGFVISLFGIGLHGAGRLTMMFIYAFPVAITFVKWHSSKNNRFLYYFYLASVLLLLSFLNISSYDPVKFDYIPIWESVKVYK